MSAAEETLHGQLALKFSEYLNSAQYQKAHQLLSSSLQAEIGSGQLETMYTEMIDYSEIWPDAKADEIIQIEVMQEMTEWPQKKENEIGWVYVSLMSNSFTEGLAIIVSSDAGRNCINHIEWGRP